jgi:hypothetical protein
MEVEITSMSNADTRVVYGVTCTWWDSIQNVGQRAVEEISIYPERGQPTQVPATSMPCCPHCGGMLFEMPHENDFMKGAQEHEADGHPGYVQFVRWARGKCFPNVDAAQSVYRSLS